MANDTRFGLAATLVTGDPERAERVSRALNAGTVWVNCFFVRDLRRALRRQRQVRHRPRGRRLVASTSTATSRTPCSPRRLDRTEMEERHG